MRLRLIRTQTDALGNERFALHVRSQAMEFYFLSSHPEKDIAILMRYVIQPFRESPRLLAYGILIALQACFMMCQDLERKQRKTTIKLKSSHQSSYDQNANPETRHPRLFS